MPEPPETAQRRRFQWREEWPLILLMIPLLFNLVVSVLLGGVIGLLLFMLFSFGSDRSLLNAGIRNTIYLVIGAVLFPIFLNARKAGRANICLVQVQKVTQSTLLYTQDYDGNLPSPVAASPAFPYIKDRSLLVCPEDKNTAVGYTLNANVTNLALHATAWPEKTILVYEGTAETFHYRHNDRAMLGFVDGHCKLIAPAEATTLFWTLQAAPNLPNSASSLPAGSTEKADDGQEIGGPVYMR